MQIAKDSAGPDMAAKNLLILTRKAAANDDLRAAIKALKADHDLDVRIPWSQKQMRKDLGREIDRGCRRVVALGGDGTLNSVVNAIWKLKAGKEVELGLVPLGTANDFARGCGLPLRDRDAALLQALMGKTRPTDLGRVNGRHFINVASGGFGAMVTATTPRDMKSVLGGLAYTLHGLARLGDLRSQTCRIALDGGGARVVSLAFAAIGNGRFAGGGFDVAPEAELDDGVLDLSIVSHDWQGAPGFLMRELMDPTNPENEAVVYRTFEHLVLETDQDFHLNLDGEPMVDRRFEISVVAAALRVVR
ncbi:YegS/Rv2252/BmrU family lipid kinase [Tropicimonas sediminicola]|uniref:Lipid kinase YegS n=1 Tax=Tropicimonas sediminicola TaxID=1031541 RepID=A0A239HWY6_9RHOB|nr:YegS/Rv2252/BmrU family lipid kinase [Tropicimonas sediminicola]SNS85900.1 lipid kinase YegS [Tropicimonas sediminicola]